MSTFKIPNNLGQIRQNNKGDISGELWETFNLDLGVSPGKIVQSKRLSKVLGNTQITDADSQDSINAIITYTNSTNRHIYVFTSADVFRCVSNADVTNSANWSAVAALNDKATEYTDAIVFGGQIRYSTNTDIGRFNGDASQADDWWTSDISGTALTTGYPHKLHIHRGGQESLFVSDKNIVRYYNSTAGHTAYTLQTDLIANTFASGVDRIWAGTYTDDGTHAYVYELQVGQALPLNAFKVEGRAVLSLWVVNNIPYVVTEKGYIQAFNGAGFETVQEFPFSLDYTVLDNVSPGNVTNIMSQFPIHPNGVVVDNTRVSLMINTKEQGTSYAVNSRSHSGIWEFNYETANLSHKQGLNDVSTDYGNSRIRRSGVLYPLRNEYSYLLAGTQVADGQIALLADSADANISWFVTSEINSQTVTDAYAAIYHKAKTLAATESIVTQYRTTKRDTVYATANWTSTTKFNTTSDMTDVEVGDLVRISHGYAAGQYANITELSSSSNTTEVTVDREIGLAANSSQIYIDNFKNYDFDEDLGTSSEDSVYSSEDGEFINIGGIPANPWVQFMVILNGNIEYREFTSKGNSKNEQ